MLGEKIKNHRIKNDISQEDIAKAIKKKVETVRQYESGKSTPSIPILVIMCSKFGVGLSEFLKDEEM